MKNLVKLEGTIYYWTTDLANGERAKDLGAVHDIRVKVLFQKELPVPPDALALFVDLDNQLLDAHGRCQYIAELTANPPRVTTCVHSCDFQEDSDAKNVLMGRWFNDTLMCRLLTSLRAITANKGIVTEGAGKSALECINDEELARIRLGSDGGPFCD